MQNELSTTVTRTLKCEFTAIELVELSDKLSTEVKNIGDLEEQKKAAVSQFTGKINAAKAEANHLANLVSDKYEYRDVECDVDYHTPEEGKKTLTRRDNGKRIVEKMDKEEFNLFNQSDLKAVR